MSEDKTMVLAAKGPIVLYAEGQVYRNRIDTETMHLRNQSAGGCTVYQVGVQDVEKPEFIYVMNVQARFVDPNSTIALYDHGLHEFYRDDKDFDEVFYMGLERSYKVLILKILTSEGEVEMQIKLAPFYTSGKWKFRIDLPEAQDLKPRS